MPRERRKSPIHDPDYVELVARMREARKARGLTQLTVANLMGRKSASFVSKIELRERRIDPIELRDFAALYDKPLAYFYLPRRKGGRAGSA